MEYGHVGKHLEDVEDISADVFETSTLLLH